MNGTASCGIIYAMENKRDIPYGVINWATLVRECLFVDNTAYIRSLEKVRTPVFLRPKRFGKSVVCSMLAHYYRCSRTTMTSTSRIASTNSSA